ncbi:hypothetical protein [Lacinutrix sp. Bg11-31]|uniref:hypothetical protein n=1 Tax=Lacinutrix sp. Bg11-31 TaxID=2057808 RepID=UPI0012FE7DDA|nr:hypothetical protein [Lacinutrix sp. Bg11-31]
MLTGIFCFNKYKNTSTRIFIFFLIYVVFVDFTGATYFYDINFKPTAYLRSIGFNSKPWYNLLWLFGSMLFVMYYIYNVLHKKYNKILILAVTVIFTTLMLGHFFIYPQVFFKTHSSYYQLVGAFTLLIGCAIYFIEFINSESITYALRTYSFYALSAVLIWWLIVTPILLFEAYNTISDIDFVNLKRRIFVFANMFMYGMFAFGLVISKPQRD